MPSQCSHLAWFNPIACPPGLVDGAACGQVNGIGCCDQNGDNWYCGDDGNSTFLVLDDCL